MMESLILVEIMAMDMSCRVVARQSDLHMYINRNLFCEAKSS